MIQLRSSRRKRRSSSCKTSRTRCQCLAKTCSSPFLFAVASSALTIISTTKAQAWTTVVRQVTYIHDFFFTNCDGSPMRSSSKSRQVLSDGWMGERNEGRALPKRHEISRHPTCPWRLSEYVNEILSNNSC